MRDSQHFIKNRRIYFFACEDVGFNVSDYDLVFLQFLA